MRCVYFIRPVGMDGPVKIGCSEAPDRRLDALMSWSPFPLEVAATVEGGIDVERRFHGMFAADRTHKEWFRPSVRLTAVITRLVAGEPLSAVLDMSAKPADFRDYSRHQDPQWRQRISYVHRIRWAFSGRGGHPPRDVREIMSRWAGYCGKDVTQPTAAEITRLEEVLSNPSVHAVTWEESWPQFHEHAEQKDAA